MDSLPAKPNLGIFYKNITKYQEINLGLINHNEDITAEEIKEIEQAAKRRAGGKVKTMTKGKGKKALRAVKGPKKLNISDPASDLIEKSFKTIEDLAL